MKKRCPGRAAIAVFCSGRYIAEFLALADLKVSAELRHVHVRPRDSQSLEGRQPGSGTEDRPPLPMARRQNLVSHVHGHVDPQSGGILHADLWERDCSTRRLGRVAVASQATAVWASFRPAADIRPYIDSYQATYGRQPLPVTVYGDATGQSRSTASKTDYALIDDYFRSKPDFRLHCAYPNKNPPVKDRVNSVNAMLKNADGRIRTLVHPRCKELITDFYEVVWKPNSQNFEPRQGVR